MVKTYTNYIVNNKQCIKIKKKKSPAKRIKLAPASMQADSHHHYAIASLY